MRILIAEDDRDGRAILKQIFDSKDAWHTTVADNGAVAWWHLSDPEGAPFDVLITDLDMPIASGVDLIQRIRGNRALNNLSVVVCSGSKDRETVQTLIKLGANGYILKPYEAKSVLQKIEALVKDRPYRSINIAAGVEA